MKWQKEYEGYLGLGSKESTTTCDTIYIAAFWDTRVNDEEQAAKVE